MALPESLVKGQVYFDTVDKKIYIDTEEERVELYPEFNASGSGHSNGLVPDPGSTEAHTKFLCEDKTWKIPYSNFTNNSGGLVPSPGSSGTQTKYLREDGTWAIPSDTNTTYSVFSNNANGLVPQSNYSGSNPTKYLCEDGTWEVPVDTNTHYETHLYVNGSSSGTSTSAVSSGNIYLHLFDDNTRRNKIQLQAGNNMTITSNSTGVITFNSTLGLTMVTSQFISSNLTEDDKVPTVKAMVTYIDSLVDSGNGGSY